jgi:hypothetical protein
MSAERIGMAMKRAQEADAAFRVAPPDGKPRLIRVAMGDPQAPLEQVLAVLDHKGLLGDDGWVRSHVQLVSMGDHFDFGKDAARAAVDGERLVAWLAAHPADQVLMIVGNHDLARVGELAGFDDARMAALAPAARHAYAHEEDDPALEQAFLAANPDVPTAECLARDFSAYRQVQRDRVWALLRARRLRVAHAAAPDLLLVHAGVTHDDLGRIDVADELHSDAEQLARVLNLALDAAVDAWTKGPLEIPWLHRPGDAAFGEGRGIFYHRPCNPAHEDPALFGHPLQRRYDPRGLPGGLIQAIGHIRDDKCLQLLHGWTDGHPKTDGPLRSLVVDGESVRYTLGIQRVEHDAAAVRWFLDGGMQHVAARDYALLDLDARAAL